MKASAPAPARTPASSSSKQHLYGRPTFLHKDGFKVAEIRSTAAVGWENSNIFGMSNPRKHDKPKPKPKP